MKGRQCRLCYGKLKNNICMDCGLDNTKSDVLYQLNHNDMNERLKRFRIDTARDDKERNTRTVEYKQPTYKTPDNTPYRTVPKEKKTKKTYGSIIVIFFVILPFLSAFFENMSWENGAIVTNEEVDTVQVEYDPYEFVEKSFEEGKGELYEQSLSEGSYIVGTDIPEGKYEVQLESGYGSLEVVDEESGIFINEWYDEKLGPLFNEDIRLFTGATVKIEGEVFLHFITNNGRVDLLEV